MKIVAMYSGGLNSTTLLFDLKRRGVETHVLTYMFHNEKHHEGLQASQKLMDEYIKPVSFDVFYIARPKNSVSLKMFTRASEFCKEKDTRWLINGMSNDKAKERWDKRVTFIESLNHLFDLDDKLPTKINAPYFDALKEDIAKAAKEFKVPADLLWSAKHYEIDLLK